MIAFMAVIMGLGPIFYILLGFGYLLQNLQVWEVMASVLGFWGLRVEGLGFRA